MRIAVPAETHPGERRAAALPETVKRYVDKGAEVVVERGLGAGLHASDAEYEAAGAKVLAGRGELFASADVVLRIRKPSLEEVEQLKEGCVHVSLLEPFNSPELIDALARRGVDAVAMELIPRSTRAQKMDVLSSQANLAGYVAVILAAERLSKILPMMMTPAGTIAPARVFVVGAGVAGLQAIATAKRLGARVDAFDTRPVVEEQVRSLGAKFVKIDLGETGQTEQGYAKELTEEQQKRQREGMARICAQSDVVITTAQVFGRRAPLIITREMIEGMRPGSVIVDLAVETGGNVEGVEPDREIEIGGVRILGLFNLPGRVAVNASQMFANNLYNFVDEFWDKDAKALRLDSDDEIVRASLVTRGGEVVSEAVKSLQRV
jgi:NAD(P) transhydrogenase subunit alpha